MKEGRFIKKGKNKDTNDGMMIYDKENGKVRFNPNSINASPKAQEGVTSKASKANASVSGPKLKRLYVISRDSIKLPDAQMIVAHASIKNPIFMSETVPLVWVSAYPDSVFGEMSLPSLLIGYAKQSEGEQYLNSNSSVILDEGSYDGY